MNTKVLKELCSGADVNKFLSDLPISVVCYQKLVFSIYIGKPFSTSFFNILDENNKAIMKICVIFLKLHAILKSL